MKHSRPAADIERSAPVKASPVKLAADMAVNQAFKAVLWAGLAQLQANERGMLAGRDPEYLHQMRVALRRMRSAFSVFDKSYPEAGTAPLRNELKWLANALGPARDWDVFVTETLPLIRAEYDESAALDTFAEQCQRPRRAAHRRAHHAVASKRYQLLVASVAGWLAAERRLARTGALDLAAPDAPVGGLARAELDIRYARVCKRRRGLSGLPATRLHRLRIAVKKFRYAADFFANLYPAKRVRELRRRLSRLQDILGAMNDAATATDLMRRVFGAARGKRILEPGRLLPGWRVATLKRELGPAWKAFRSAGRFWQ